MFTASYVSLVPVKKSVFWESLKDHRFTINLSWLIAGDLNDISVAFENFGGAPLNMYRTDLFNSCINACRLIDLGFTSNPFTWLGTRSGGVLVKEWLDRALSNVEWRVTFPEAFVKHLPHVCSDHHPILIDLMMSPRSSFLKPFRFEAMWTMHHGLENLLHSNWESRGIVHDSSLFLSTALIKWNKQIFGDVFHAKHWLLARIDGIQKVPDYHLHPYFSSLERERA